MEWKEVFTVDKPVFGNASFDGPHTMGRAGTRQKETDLLFEAGVDAVIVEDYFGDVEDAVAVLQWLQKSARTGCTA